MLAELGEYKYEGQVGWVNDGNTNLEGRGHSANEGNTCLGGWVNTGITNLLDYKCWLNQRNINLGGWVNEENTNV